MERERSVKAETIQPAPARIAHSRRAVLALIQEGAGLLTFKQVYPEPDPVLGDDKIAGRPLLRGVKQTVDHGQPFELANPGVVALNDQTRMEFLDEQFGPHSLQRIHSARQRLYRKTIPVAVNYQAGQEV